MRFTVETRIVLLFLISLFLFGCGRHPEEVSGEELKQRLQSNLGNSALADAEVQNELRTVTGEVQNAILSAIVPEYTTTAMVNTAAAATCKPKFKFVLIGVGIEFTPGGSCKLSGTIALKLFPLTAVADLEVVGMKHVERIQLDADIQLMRTGKHVTVNLVFLNANFSIRKIKLLPIENVTANGKVAINIAANVFTINSRVNAFEATTGFGVALIADIDRPAGRRELKSCVLAQGQASDPNAGTLSACFTLGGN